MKNRWHVFRCCIYFFHCLDVLSFFSLFRVSLGGPVVEMESMLRVMLYDL